MRTPQEYTGTRLTSWEKGVWYRNSESLPLPEIDVTPISQQFFCAVQGDGGVGYEWLSLRWGVRLDLAAKMDSRVPGRAVGLTEQEMALLASPEGWTRPYWTWETPNFRFAPSERKDMEDVIAWMDMEEVPEEWVPEDDEDDEDEEE